MDTPTLLQHRMLKFRHLGGFIEGEPVEPSKKVNMKKKEEAVVPKEPALGDLNLEDEIEKLKQQILSSRAETASQTPDLGLNEMIAKLKEEVDQEFAEAARTMGFMERLEALKREVAKAGSSADKQLDSSLKEKIQRVRQEFNESLPRCPNFASLSYKLDMLKDVLKAKRASEGNDKASSLKQQVNDALRSVLERADIREKVKLLKTEISDAGVMRPTEVDAGLREHVLKVKREVESEVVEALKTLQLSVEGVAPRAEASGVRELFERPPYAELGEEMEDLEDQIAKRIADTSKSADLNDRIEMLKLEMAKAGPSPDLETRSRIESMKQRVKQDLAEAVTCPQLTEKFDKLKQEIARRRESSPGSAESLEGGAAQFPGVEINVGSSSLF